MLVGNNQKTFEKPDSGLYHGVLADIVDLGLVTTSFNNQTKTQPMVRFMWALDKLGKDGEQLFVTKRYNLSLHEKATLYKDVKQILQAAPRIPYELENLVGKTRKLLVVKETAADGQDFANIQGILPADSGVAVTVPADFVRDKNKPVEQQAKNKKPFVQNQTRQTTQVAAPATPAAQTQGADVAF